MHLSWPIMVSTFGLIFVAELPDKTALAALILAARYRVRDVVAGAWLAFLVQTIVAVAAGSLLTLLPAKPVGIAAGLGFLAFAFLAYRRNEEEEEAEEGRRIAEGRMTRPAWFVSFLVIFAAEWGDLTQLATAALVAHSRNPISVGVGALLALWCVTVVAAFAGTGIAKVMPPAVLSRIGAVLFAAIGLVVLYSNLR